MQDNIMEVKTLFPLDHIKLFCFATPSPLFKVVLKKRKSTVTNTMLLKGGKLVTKGRMV